MHPFSFPNGLKFLDGYIWEPDQVKVWVNSEPIDYFRLHISYDTLAVPDLENICGPSYFRKAIEENAVGLTPAQRVLFPVIEDFEVHFVPGNKTSVTDDDQDTYQPCFFSASQGFLSDIAVSWDDYTVAHVCHNTFHVPCGSFAVPYFQLEQYFTILIAEKDGFVYVLRGEFENIQTEGYGIWFKVERNRYFSEWEKAIQMCHRYCVSGCASGYSG
ncbi:hypothetical protein [Dictyobacter aurantiacus]|uniref:Uncharacterized protein n=1 Tax=Dictyobacter aurantiacus TaxID=1936993 RepID=A0A401ZQN9_9CHLR|nr:hypothetical protein [Dictyobacter aurantiacus]GCE09187.1 hypothetical protein KDAU_65160 [Dictyobacter aurantiacus]